MERVTKFRSASSSEEAIEDYEGPEIENRVSRIISRRFSGQVEDFDNSDLPKMGEGKRYPPMINNREQYRVGFDGPDDPIRPVNWPMARKLKVAAVVSFGTLSVAWGSASYAPAMEGIEHRFHVGNVVAALGISFYVLGFATGPVVWGPLSEVYGRKLPMLASFFLLTCFTFGSAAAKDYQTLMLCRFFGGALGSAPVTVGAAILSDMFSIELRGVAMNIFTLCIMGGPMIAPVVAAFIASSYLGWRWTLYITGIMSAASFVLLIIFQDETYAPSVLSWKARNLRKRTGNWAIYAELETFEFSISNIVRRNILKPTVMLATEPILLLISLYNGFVYGILYMSLESMPFIFSGYGWTGGKLYLPYVSLFIGCILSVVVAVSIFDPKFRRDLKASGLPVLPEARLPVMMFGGIFFSLGLFWLCWSGAYPQHVHWIVPCLGACCYGIGFVSLFTPVFSYVIDTYQDVAASALSGNALMRGALGAAFPLFARAMFQNLGIQWAGTLIGCLSLLLLPVPFLFYRYGAWIRSKSRYTTKVGIVTETPETPVEEEKADEINYKSLSTATTAAGV